MGIADYPISMSEREPRPPLHQPDSTPEESSQNNETLINTIAEKLQSKYNVEVVPFHVLHLQLDNLKEAFGSLENVKGKRILDLGCGSVLPTYMKKGGAEYYNSVDYERVADNFNSAGNSITVAGKFTSPPGRLFEPWLCRALLELGAQPVGVDVGPLKGEEFEHYRLDLTQTDALSFLPDKSFDAINMRLLLSSPQLERMAGKAKRNDMKEELKKQVGRLLKDDGVMIYSDLEDPDHQ